MNDIGGAFDRLIKRLTIVQVGLNELKFFVENANGGPEGSDLVEVILVLDCTFDVVTAVPEELFAHVRAQVAGNTRDDDFWFSKFHLIIKL